MVKLRFSCQTVEWIVDLRIVPKNSLPLSLLFHLIVLPLPNNSHHKCLQSVFSFLEAPTCYVPLTTELKSALSWGPLVNKAFTS